MALPAQIDLTDVDKAAAVAAALLHRGTERWRHTQAVANRAQELTAAVPPDERLLLVAAAWLHDIGYSDELRRTGFHPLDGARHLQDNGGDPRLAALVAHHSGARFVAANLGLARELADFEFEENALSDALTAADQTIDPNGYAMSLEDRMADMLSRHGAESPNAKVHSARAPYLRAAVDRTLRRLGSSAPTSTSRTGGAGTFR